MQGIDLNKPAICKCASFRYFQKKEHHITRFCPDDVLLLVFDGVLRFSEDGEEIEVSTGEYYIQQKNRYQGGAIASDEPTYFYVHFCGEWTEQPNALPARGHFDASLLFDTMTKLDRASHQNAPYCELQYLFLKLLMPLRKEIKKSPIAEQISDFVEKNIQNPISLDDLCQNFHYSKNYIIRLFNREFNSSPIQYINEIKLRHAMYLLETTSKIVGEIATECGYADYPYFYKRFIKRTGKSPKEYREQIQKSPF